MNHDIAAVNEFPSINSWVLVSVSYFQTLAFKNFPDLIGKASEMSYARHCGYDEEVSPAASCRYIHHSGIDSVVFLKKFPDIFCLGSQCLKLYAVLFHINSSDSSSIFFYSIPIMKESLQFNRAR